MLLYKQKICSKGDFMEPINETQKRIYEFLVERSQDGVPPSVREIGAAVGLKSTSSVQANLDSLEKAGYIMRDPLLKRSIRILGQAENITHVPLLGTVTAGMPILAVEQIEGYIPYTGRVSRDKPLFALKVRGESMLWAGILNGDIVIAEKTNTTIAIQFPIIKSAYSSSYFFAALSKHQLAFFGALQEKVLIPLRCKKSHQRYYQALNRVHLLCQIFSLNIHQPHL